MKSVSLRPQSIIFYSILLVSIIAAFVVLRPYLTTIILALLTIIIFRKPYYFILKRVKNRKSIATFFTILFIFFSFLVPLLVLVILIVNQSILFFNLVLNTIAENPTQLADMVAQFNVALSQSPFAGTTLDATSVLDSARNTVQPVLSGFVSNATAIGSKTMQFITATIVYIMLLATLFPRMSQLKAFFLDISPFDTQTDLLYLRRIIAMCESMIVGTFVIALVQGLAAALTLYVVGVEYVFFWFVLYFLLSIVPLGGGLIMIPIGVVLIATGQVWQGIFVILSQLLFISNIDNLLRPRIVSKEITMNPTWLLIGVLGGISVFGFFGLIYGPVILVFLQTTIEIYRKYYRLSPLESKLEETE